jgi:drug/metabolite transporter (DMT)-like permease
MISWLLIIIIAYLCFGVASFADKLVLSAAPNPKLYTLWVGVLGAASALVIPFVHFGLPMPSSWFWIIADGIVFFMGVYYLFIVLHEFEVSQVIPAIGAVQPVLTFVFSLIFFGFQPISTAYVIAFVLLVIGTVLLSFEKSFTLNGRYVKLVLIASLLFSLDYIFSKMVFINEPFWQGLIWMKVVTGLIALCFLFDKEVRYSLFVKPQVANKKTLIAVVLALISGASAGLLQSFAIKLAPVGYLAIMNSLRGLQYVFLFALSLFFSVFFPTILKEELSARILIKKIVSIGLIFVGLAILFL